MNIVLVFGDFVLLVDYLEPLLLAVSANDGDLELLLWFFWFQRVQVIVHEAYVAEIGPLLSTQIRHTLMNDLK